jgi:hypothetical protein
MTDKVNYRTLEGIQTHPLFTQLTVRQRKFLLTYIETNGDKEAAVKASYEFNTKVAAEVHVSRVLGNRNIRTLLGAYYGTELPTKPLTQNETEELLSERLRDRKIAIVYFLPMIKLYTQLRGWVVAPPVDRGAAAKASKKPGTSIVADLAAKNLNDLVLRMEKEGRETVNEQSDESDVGEATEG